MHTIIFFDNNKEHINIYQKILSNIDSKYNLLFINCEFEDLLNSGILHIAVSPANSYLSMTGGIDRTFAECFPGIENNLRKICIQKKYAVSDTTYKGTKYIVPVGKCVIAKTMDNRCPFILAAPTMKMPKNISGTNNIYEAMKAILTKINLITSRIVIGCCCLGTGIGNMSAEHSAQQIRQAFMDFI